MYFCSKNVTNDFSGYLQNIDMKLKGRKRYGNDCKTKKLKIRGMKKDSKNS